jgi:DNA-binding transcriptional regulator PaaX
MSNTKEKILLLLLGGLAFGCSYTPSRQMRVLKTVSREWKKLGNENLRKSVNDLYRYEFIGKIKKEDGSFNIFLTEKGKWRALNFQLENVKNKKEKWDRKWRMIAFDIPEKYKRGRDALRQKLKKIGFCEMQKSVLITPYDCKKEMELLVKFFELDEFVRFAVLEYIDNEEYFKKFFKIA